MYNTFFLNRGAIRYPALPQRMLKWGPTSPRPFFIKESTDGRRSTGFTTPFIGLRKGSSRPDLLPHKSRQPLRGPIGSNEAYTVAGKGQSGPTVQQKIASGSNYADCMWRIQLINKLPSKRRMKDGGEATLDLRWERMLHFASTGRTRRTPRPVSSLRSHVTRRDYGSRDTGC